MANYNRPGTALKTPVAVPAGVIGTKKSAKPVLSYEGHSGFERKSKSALFLLAAGSLGGEDTFYESGSDRTKRFVELVRLVAVKDAAWMAGFLLWLRSEGNIRTASVVGAVEAADAMAKAGIAGGRAIVASVLQRADEPGEAVAYWFATRGRKVLMPKPIKRGIADAVLRLYNEFSFMKYDSSNDSVRFGDVIELVHPVINQAAGEKLFPEPDEAAAEIEAEDMAGWLADQNTFRFRKITQWVVSTSHLFRYAIEKRHNRGTEPHESLSMIRAQQALRAAVAAGNTAFLLDTKALKAAGMTWEDAQSLAGQVKLDKGKTWKAILPTLGIMALIRNIRNLDEAGVSDAEVAPAIARLMDAEQIARSRQLPYRFYSAFKAAPSLRWGHALEVALGHSLKNIPTLGGRTLILIDTSGSMSGGMLSANSKMTYQEVAGLFGIALGMKGEADVYGWADRPFLFPMAKGSSVLGNLTAYMSKNGVAGHGTNLGAAFLGAYVPGKYARVVVISDMQIMSLGRGVIPTDIPCYFFNLAGYASAAVETKGMVYELGGLTDHTFKMITMLEAGQSGKWPWEK